MDSTHQEATGKPPEYILHLRPVADDSADGDVDGIRRLRRLLKSLARYWGLRCVAIRPPLPEEQEGQS